MTDYETQYGITSVADAMRERDEAQVFLHCYVSQPNIDRLAKIFDSTELYAERALILAGPGDVVCVKDPVERESLAFLAGLGPVPEYDAVLVADPFKIHPILTPLSDQIAADPRMLFRIDQILPQHGTVCLNCYMFTEAEERLAHLLESALGRAIRTTGGSAAAVARANQKHFVRAKAQDMGIPVAPGEAVILPRRGDKRPGDMGMLDRAIRSWLPVTGKVIIRGSVGASGSSTFLVDSTNQSRTQALDSIRERTDNSVYMVEVMFPTTLSPNIGMFISPATGKISCVSVTDQILVNGVNYFGNTYPSRAGTIADMITAAYQLTEWLRDDGVSGYVGFDFCEYEPKRGGAPRFFLSEINPRVNGATYAAALMQKINRTLSQTGVQPVEAFVTKFADSEARTFGELRRLLGRHFFDPAKGVGVVPFNIGRLATGRCVFAVFGESLPRVQSLFREVWP